MYILQALSRGFTIWKHSPVEELGWAFGPFLFLLLVYLPIHAGIRIVKAAKYRNTNKLLFGLLGTLLILFGCMMPFYYIYFLGNKNISSTTGARQNFIDQRTTYSVEMQRDRKAINKLTKEYQIAPETFTVSAGDVFTISERSYNATGQQQSNILKTTYTSTTSDPNLIFYEFDPAVDFQETNCVRKCENTMTSLGKAICGLNATIANVCDIPLANGHRLFITETHTTLRIPEIVKLLTPKEPKDIPLISIPYLPGYGLQHETIRL